jgi:hypothetical protein
MPEWTGAGHNLNDDYVAERTKRLPFQRVSPN